MTSLQFDTQIKINLNKNYELAHKIYETGHEMSGARTNQPISGLGKPIERARKRETETEAHKCSRAKQSETKSNQSETEMEKSRELK